MPSKRNHTKSRLGCKQCKRRRIKCDERPPCCANCARKGLECDYEAWRNTPKSMQLLTQEHFHRKDSVQPLANGVSNLIPLPPSPLPSFTLEDLSLLHHFTMHTSETLDAVGNQQYINIWRHEVPPLAHSHLYLMHALLGFAAAHRATATGDRSNRCMQVRRYHYSKALVSFRESVNEITSGLADALLCYCTLISFLTLCLEFDRPDIEHDHVGSFVNFVNILQSSNRILVETQTRLRPTGIGGLLSHINDQPGYAVPDEVASSLDRLQCAVMLRTAGTSIDPNRLTSIQEAIIKLRELFTRARPKPQSWAYLLSWPSQLSPDFCTLLQQRCKPALCVLSHWCVPAHFAPSKWWVGSWPKHIMLAIAREVNGTEWADCIQWPWQEIMGEGVSWDDAALLQGSCSPVLAREVKSSPIVQSQVHALPSQNSPTDSERLENSSLSTEDWPGMDPEIDGDMCEEGEL